MMLSKLACDSSSASHAQVISVCRDGSRVTERHKLKAPKRPVFG
jgi:hypothetical protein